MKNTKLSLIASICLIIGLQACSSDDKSTVTLKGRDTSSSSSALKKIAEQSGTIDASSLKMKVYKFAVSASALCTDPITVFTSADGEEKDIANNPTFGSGDIDAGTYPCVMIEVSKTIKTASSSNTGDCVKDLEFSDVICNDGQKSKLIDGTNVTCSDATPSQHITVYMTTQTTSSGGDRALLPPTSSSDHHSGVVLTSAFEAEGAVTATLSVSLHNFLGSSGTGICFTSPPPFTLE